MGFFTDHLPLVSDLRNHSNRHTEREIRQLDFLSQFDLKFRHVKGGGGRLLPNLYQQFLSRPK